MRPLSLVIAIGLLVGFAAGSLAAGCASTKHAATEAGHTVVDCAKASQSDIVATIAKLAAAVVKTGSWHAAYEAAEQAGVTIGGCALAALVNEYAAPAPIVPDGAVSRAAPDPAREALEQLRAAHGGVRWSIER